MHTYQDPAAGLDSFFPVYGFREQQTSIWEFPKIGDPNMVPKIVGSIFLGPPNKVLRIFGNSHRNPRPSAETLQGILGSFPLTTGLSMKQLPLTVRINLGAGIVLRAIFGCSCTSKATFNHFLGMKVSCSELGLQAAASALTCPGHRVVS